MKLEMLKQTYAVCRLADAREAKPGGEFFSLSISETEVSLVCEQDRMPPGCTAETGWRAMRVSGTLAFSEVGVLAALTGALAQAGISVFAVSSYDTDYLLVKQETLPAAQEALGQAGYRFE